MASDSAMAVTNPLDVPRARALIRQLCALQAHVASEIHGYRHAADCFCGDEGFWPYGEADNYRNEGLAVAFIVEATLSEIERRKGRQSDAE